MAMSPTCTPSMALALETTLAEWETLNGVDCSIMDVTKT
jgi:hypothetical protein